MVKDSTDSLRSFAKIKLKTGILSPSSHLNASSSNSPVPSHIILAIVDPSSTGKDKDNDPTTQERNDETEYQRKEEEDEEQQEYYMMVGTHDGKLFKYTMNRGTNVTRLLDLDDLILDPEDVEECSKGVVHASVHGQSL